MCFIANEHKMTNDIYLHQMLPFDMMYIYYLAVISRVNYMNNPEKKRAISRINYMNNPEKKATSRVSYMNNPEKKIVISRINYIHNFEKKKAASKASYLRDPTRNKMLQGSTTCVTLRRRNLLCRTDICVMLKKEICLYS